jgi:hypothetical protein
MYITDEKQSWASLEMAFNNPANVNIYKNFVFSLFPPWLVPDNV